VKDIKRNITIKLFSIYGFIVLALLSVIIKIMVIQTQDPDTWKGDMMSSKVDTIKAFRGDIYDCEGRLLATSIPSYTVHWDMTVKNLYSGRELYAKYIDSLSICMSEFFKDKTPQEYRKFFDSARQNERLKRYYPIKNNLTFSQKVTLKTFPIMREARNTSGVIFQAQYRRHLPHKSLARRTIGFVGSSRVGLEGAYDAQLHGRNGKKLMIKLPSSEYYPISYDDEIEPVDGSDVISTLDVNIQDIAEQSLLKQLQRCDAKYGCAVVMEVKTGKIRAMANLNAKIDTATGKILGYVEGENHAVGTLMEPGSTFKLPSLIAVLEKTNGEITDSIDLGDGELIINDHIIRDDHPLQGYRSIREIFEKSSNVGMAKLVFETFKSDSRDFINRLYYMHLKEKTGIDIHGEGEPQIRHPKDKLWWVGSLAAIAYGYEVRLTPLQILTFYNAIANNGVMLKPHLMEAIRTRNGKKTISSPEILHSSICGKGTLQKVQQLLIGVVESGTAVNLKTPNYTIAGKTGTAQIAQGKTGYKTESGYARHSASFVGYFPAEKPKYSCIVVINSPSKYSYYGGVVAGPVFREIADKLYSKDYELTIGKEFNLLNYENKTQIPHSKSGRKEVLDRLFSAFNIQAENVKDSQTPFVYTSKGNNGIRLDAFSMRKGVMPDVKGMGLRDALYILRNKKLKVTVVGRGEVKKQSIAPGTAVSEGTKVTIELG